MQLQSNAKKLATPMLCQNEMWHHKRADTWNPSSNTTQISLSTAAGRERQQGCASKLPPNLHNPQTQHLSSPASSSPASVSDISPRCHGPPYLAAGPFPGRISAPWSTASSRPSSLLPRRFFPLSKLCCTLLSCGLAWQSFSTKKSL